jgi:class 3 adenylate cyclase
MDVYMQPREAFFTWMAHSGRWFAASIRRKSTRRHPKTIPAAVYSFNMTDSPLLETLASYVPPLFVRRIAADPSPVVEPHKEQFTAAALFADISGFTALTERLAQRGPQGVEELSRLLNDYFGRLIDLIAGYGGEVVRFAGDGMLALWPTSAEPDTYQARQALLNACQCALDIQTRLKNYEVSPGVVLSLRIGVAAGEIVAEHIGGIFRRWEFLIAGDPLIQVGLAQHEARPGQVVLSPQVQSLLSDVSQAAPVENGCFMLTGLRVRVTPILPSEPPLLTNAAEPALRAYIPGAILSRLSAGQSDWLAELRRISVLFVNLPDLGAATPIEQAQEVMQSLQTALYRYEGSINKLNVDDKGVTLIAALGLHPLAHEDDATRSIQAGLAIQAELIRLGMNAAIGISTGRAFCGSIGNIRRREYTMIGDVVNLAARLMQAAGRMAAERNARIPILCDEQTYLAARNHIQFEELPRIMVKGKAEPVAIYRPLTTRKAAVRPHAQLIGRARERAVLAEALQALLRGASQSVILIEGEAGIGKSRLVEDLIRQAEALQIEVLSGAGDAIEQSTTYFAWRDIFTQLLKIDVYDSSDNLEKRIHKLLEVSPDLLPMASLLNTVLPVHFAETELALQLGSQARAENTRALLLHILQQELGRVVKVIILEDAHWLDSASWALANLVAQRMQPLLMIIATRPLSTSRLQDSAMPAEYLQLREHANTLQLQVNELSPEETVELVCQRLGAASLPDNLASFILRKAEGHPFFTEELAYALRDAELIQVTPQGDCRLAPGVESLDRFDFPDNIQGVITSRVDRLSPQLQLALKVASVIGRAFAYRVLQDVYPVTPDKPRLIDYLGTLERLDITPLESPEPELTYIFKHAITQEVTYNLMLFAQRQELHRAVAEWYEQQAGADLDRHYPLLAYHWTRAEDTEKAIQYLELAGQQALRNYANEEAVHFLEEALNLRQSLQRAGSQTTQADVSATENRRIAAWRRQIGQAYLGLGKLKESQTHLVASLEMLRKPIPASATRLILEILGLVLEQAAHRLLPPAWFALDPEQHPELREAARGYDLLGEIYYFANETLPSLHTALRSLNLAEQAGPSPELTRAYANMAVGAGLVSLHNLATDYGQRALAIARQTGHQPSLAHAHRLFGVYLSGIGNWIQARENLEQARQICLAIGDRRNWGESVSLLAMLAYLQGNFQESTRLYRQLLDAARRTNDLQQQGWGLDGLALCALRQGNLEQARESVETALRQQSTGEAAPGSYRYGAIFRSGVLALIHSFRGDKSSARQAADQASALIAQSSPTIFSIMEGYASVAQVYLELWEAGEDTPDLKEAARQAVQHLRQFGRIYPFAVPRAELLLGELQWLSGQRSAARLTWNRCLAAARRLEMAFEAAYAQHEIGALLGGEEGEAYLRQALEGFQALGAQIPGSKTAGGK